MNLRRHDDVRDDIFEKWSGVKKGTIKDNRTAREICNDELTGNRKAHVLAVAEKTIKDDYKDAAYLHDIGYGESINKTGFHPWDGAVWLFERGWGWEVLYPVLFHSLAKEEAIERGLDIVDAYLELELWMDEDSKIRVDDLSYVDIRTGPKGEDLAPEDRIDEILRRYPEEHIVHIHVKKNKERLCSFRRIS